MRATMLPHLKLFLWLKEWSLLVYKLKFIINPCVQRNEKWLPRACTSTNAALIKEGSANRCLSDVVYVQNILPVPRLLTASYNMGLPR